MNKKIEISNQVTKLSYALIIVIVLCSVLFIYMFSTINSLEDNLIKQKIISNKKIFIDFVTINKDSLSISRKFLVCL